MKNYINIKNYFSGLLPIVRRLRCRQCGVISLFLIVSLGMCLLCSCFSPLFSLVLSADSSCFYMQGHAWAEGLIPYVDFIDVKGPLLFFLFKIACCLTPDSTTGAYLLFSCAGCLCLYFSYRTGLLLIEDNKKAILASLAMLPVMFWWKTYLSGGQSEELMAPFYALLLYACLRYMKKMELPSSLILLSTSIGIGAGTTLLIKYNCTFVFAVAFALLLISLIFDGRWRSILTQCIPVVLISFSIIVAPFIIYLWLSDTLQSCWNIYVVLNFSTFFGSHTSMYSTGSGITKIVCYAEMLFRCREGLWASIGIFAACCYPFSLRRDKKRCAMLLVILFSAYFSCMARYHDYYMLFCAPSCIIPVSFVLRHISAKLNTFATCSLAIVLLYATVRGNGQWADRAPMRVSQKLSGSVAKAEEMICSMKHPRILYLGELDRGFGVSVGALPACPEWCTLNGVSNDFLERQRQAVIQRKADFVVILSERYGSKPTSYDAKGINYASSYDVLCQANGYVRVCSFTDQKGEPGLHTVYAKRKTKE